MISKIILSFVLASNFLIGSVGYNGKVLGVNNQEKGDKVEINGPIRIANNNLGVKIEASHALVVDIESGEILFAKNADKQNSIASITKLMTALVFLDTNPDLESEITIKVDDLAGAGNTTLLLGERVKLKDLLHLSLVASDNNATLAMVRATGMKREEFVRKMNIKAIGLGFEKTNFSDPVGLNAHNVSTPIEIYELLKLARKHAMINKILTMDRYSFTSVSDKYHSVQATDKLLDSYLNILGGKTGYIEEAGFCFASAIKLNNGHEIISVVLGSIQPDGRFQDTKALADWVENNYIWK